MWSTLVDIHEWAEGIVLLSFYFVEWIIVSSDGLVSCPGFSLKRDECVWRAFPSMLTMWFCVAISGQAGSHGGACFLGCCTQEVQSFCRPERNRWSPELWASAQQLSGPRRQLSQMEAGFTLCSLKLSCSLSDATEGTGLQFYSNFFSLIPHDKHIGGKKIWNMDACRRWGLLPVYDWRSHFDGLTWMMESCMIVEDLSISYL